MEKSHSRSSTKSLRHAVGGDSFPIEDLVLPRRANAQAKDKPAPDKLSREDISRCINIWASLYLKTDDQADKRDLCLPSRPWLGRTPGVKRFE